MAESRDELFRWKRLTAKNRPSSTVTKVNGFALSDVMVPYADICVCKDWSSLKLCKSCFGLLLCTVTLSQSLSLSVTMHFILIAQRETLNMFFISYPLIDYPYIFMQVPV